MEGDRIEMSQRERDRLRVMSLVLEGKRTQREAGRLLSLCERQVRRIRKKLDKEGDAAVVHKLRGRPSNRRIDPAHRAKVLARCGAELKGFGPTFAAEKLSEEGLPVAVRTLREWLLAEGLWQRHRRSQVHRQRRERRACRGELVQADGSHHDWLEGRGPRMVLLVMIDDATSQVMARFYPAETTEAYMALLERYLRTHGRMVAMYVDGDSIFRSEDHHPDDPQPMLTQFGRALQELDIRLIQAGSPQAKGRVERFNGTAQDRLVKELRLAGASTLEEANAVLEKAFLPWFHRHCTVAPQSPNDAHRPLSASMNLKAILSIQKKRHVANDYTIRLDNQLYQLLPPPVPGLRGGRLTVEKRFDGSIHLRFKDQYLSHKALGAAKKPGALPPYPRSLPPWQSPALAPQSEGSAAATVEPCAVPLASGRSGRTPAKPATPKAGKPYPPKGTQSLPRTHTRRPAPDHPWRKTFKLPTGHF